MTALVEDLLLLARLDAGRPLERERGGPDPAARSRPSSDARVVGPDHRWRLDLPDEPVRHRRRRTGCTRCVTNLLTNARKHTPPGTTVAVAARRTAVGGRCCGRRRRPGIPPELVPRLRAVRPRRRRPHPRRRRRRPRTRPRRGDRARPRRPVRVDLAPGRHRRSPSTCPGEPPPSVTFARGPDVTDCHRAPSIADGGSTGRSAGPWAHPHSHPTGRADAAPARAVRPPA